MNKTYKRILILVTLLVILILYLINAKLIIDEVLNYSKLFITKLFPVTIIFYILSYLLIDYGIVELFSKYLKINTAKLYIIIMSIISGFPSGSKYTKELLNKNIISLNTANKLIMGTHFPNPLFIIGTVNEIINNKNLTLLILLSITISNILILIIFNNKEKNQLINNYTPPKDFANSLSNAITTSLKTIIIIYGTSLFFYLITIIINKYIILNTTNYVLINGLFDLTKGVTSTALIKDKLKQSLFIITFISFGGISIHMQTKSILSDTLINYKYFFLGRIISTFTSIIIFLLLIKFTT